MILIWVVRARAEGLQGSWFHKSEVEFLTDLQLDRLMGFFNDTEHFPKQFDILFRDAIKQWTKIRNGTNQLFWVSPKTDFVCPMFFSDWRQVNDPELVRANWLSDRGLRDVIIPSLRKSSNTSQHDAAHIFETLFLGGVGANTLTILNKDFSVQNTEWKHSEF